jgi:pimeloyl-ACP methyl ester carboxylesterase
MNAAVLFNLAWDVGRRAGKPLAASIILTLSAALLAAVLPQQLMAESLSKLFLLGFGMSLATAIYGFHSTEGSRRSGFGSFPRRLFVLPVATRWLVGVPMLLSLLVVCGLYLLWAGVILPRTENHFPLDWPCLFLAAASLGFQALLWSIPERRLLKLILLGTYGTVLNCGWLLFREDIATAIITEFWANAGPKDAALIIRCLLVGIMLIAIAMGLICVRRQRYDQARRKARSALPNLRFGTSIPFRSVAAALFWHEWRMVGLVLPIAVGLINGFFLLLSAGVGQFSAQATLNALILLVCAPFSLAWIIGVAFVKPDFWSNDLELPVAIRIRPIRGNEFVVARLKVAALTLGITWLITLLTIAIWIPHFSDLRYLMQHWQSIQHLCGPDTFFILTGFAVLLFLAGYRGLVGGLEYGIHGSARPFARFEYLRAFGPMAGLGGIIYLAADSARRPILVEVMRWSPLVLATLLMIKAKRAIGPIAMTNHTWLMVGAGAVSLFAIELGLTNAVHLKCLLMLITLAMLPLAGPNRAAALMSPPTDPKSQGWQIAAAILLLSGWLGVTSFKSMPTTVNAGGPQLRMKVLGKSKPIVVFEQFGPVPLEMWSRVQLDVAAFATTVTYDHAGGFGSQEGPRPRDGERIAAELREALRNASLTPPYIIVGFSGGAAYARIFAGAHPNEMAGLVLIDPSLEDFFAWSRQQFPKLNRISEAQTAKQTEWGLAYRSLHQAETAARPSIPVTIISGGHQRDTPVALKSMPVWLQTHHKLATQLNGRHVISTNSGHEIIFAEPNLVVAEIRRICDLIRASKSTMGR